MPNRFLLTLCQFAFLVPSLAWHLSFPGTLWCGPGHTESSSGQLGVAKETDSCCRDHDRCSKKIGKPPCKPFEPSTCAKGKALHNGKLDDNDNNNNNNNDDDDNDNDNDNNNSFCCML